MPEIWFLRHGESTSNVEKLVTGAATDPLTDCGRQQAIEAGIFLSSQERFKPQLIVTSAMRRAIETAELLDCGKISSIFPCLNETDAGSVARWKRTDFDAAYPDFWDPFDADRPFPDGESHMDLYRRVVDRIQQISSSLSDDGQALVVAHGGTISSTLHWAFGVDMCHFSRFVSQNCTLTILSFDGANVPSLRAFNHVAGRRVVL